MGALAHAALPQYFPQHDLEFASPGLSFGLYLPLWKHDWSLLKNDGKNRHQLDALRRVLKYTERDISLSRALSKRQSELALALDAQGGLLTIEATAIAPFTTGLGNEHPLENGFAFLNPYGLPYLAGSGVKGVLRQSARELASGEWGDAGGWNQSAIDALFGQAPAREDDSGRRGALLFWDVLPQIAGDTLQVEVMTAHQSHYYQQRRESGSGNSDSPHESGKPSPINFLTLPPGSRFVFHIQCDPMLLASSSAHELAQDGKWQTLLQTALTHAFAWLGFGAKTAVGYGAMAEDKAANSAREQARQQMQEKELAAQAAAAKEAARAAMSPDDLAWDDAQAKLETFRAKFDKAKAAGAFNPGGIFNAERLEFMRLALSWNEERSRRAAGELLASTATKAWGRPSNKDTWKTLQEAIAALEGDA